MQTGIPKSPMKSIKLKPIFYDLAGGPASKTMICRGFQRLRRKKAIDCGGGVSNLARCLTTWDLTGLGIGATMGVGIYVLTGQVSKDVAGPSIVLSFLLAGMAAAMSGLCYAEMGARVPKAGSAYVYTYVTMGEGLAVVVGWNLVLEYAIGTASVARGYSGYLDNLLNNTMSRTFRDTLPIDVPHLSPYPDFCAFAITLLLTVILSLGVKLSTRFNNVFTALNFCVVLFVVLAGMTKADWSNWNVKANATEQSGEGGFFPFGISGTLAGAATCFYGYVGFDSVATSGEEAINPHRAIPIAIVTSLSVVCVMYIGVSTSLTLMVPYYLQDSAAPIPAAFQAAGMAWAGNLVSIGALFGLSTSLLGAMFPLPRILYAMGSDGVLFRWLARVNGKLQSPIVATVISGFLVAIIAAMFELKSLVDMMSIGTLMAFTIVSVCVLLLRYESSSNNLGDYMSMSEYSSSNESSKVSPDGMGKRSCYGLDMNGDSEEEELIYYNESDDTELIAKKRKKQLMKGSSERRFTVPFRTFCLQAINWFGHRSPSATSTYVAKVLGMLATGLTVVFAFTLIVLLEGGRLHLARASTKAMVFLPLSLLLILCTICLCLQPSSDEELDFKVPFVPVLPLTSVFFNSYLMMKLPPITWVRFGVWLAIGVLIYCVYGWRNSSEEYRQLGEIPPNEVSGKESNSKQ